MSDDLDPRAEPGRRRVHRHPLREVERRRRADREDHDRPPRGAQRVPPANGDRDLPGVRARARGHRGRRDRPHRRGPATRSAPAATSACAATRATSTSDDGRRAGVGRFHVTDLHVQIRRLPKPVVAMVAGYAIGGGHVLHLVCDLTIAADNARFGQVGPAVGSFDGGFGAGLLANLVGPKKAKEIWFLCRQYAREEALEMGLVNTVVPLERLEAGDGRVVPGDARALAVRAAPAEGELQRRRGRPVRDPAARPRRQPALLRQRGGAGGPRRVPREAQARLLALPGASDGHRRPRRASATVAHLGDGGARAHAAGGGRAGAGRHLAGARRRALPPAGVPRGAARRDLHPGRHQPVERLLRRAPGRRHRGSPRAGARDRRRARAAEPGAARHLRDLRPRGRCAAST